MLKMRKTYDVVLVTKFEVLHTLIKEKNRFNLVEADRVLSSEY